MSPVLNATGTSGVCRVCGRPLRDPISIQRGVGPVCYSKNGGEAGLRPEANHAWQRGERIVSGPLFDPSDPNAVLKLRRNEGRASANVPRRHVHHSPDGFEFGYGGSGPADLALNITALIHPLQPGEEGVRLWDGSRVSACAWDKHQPFKAAVIERVPDDGADVSVGLIRDVLDALDTKASR